MILFLWLLLFTGVSGVALGLMFLFIRLHRGHLPSGVLTAGMWLLTIACAGTDILRLPPGAELVRHLLLYTFAMLFVLTDVTCRWLPFEFTATFLLGVLLARGTAQPDTLLPALVSAACMWGVLMACRALINHRYARDTFGPGDVWMMTGLAACFLFTPAACVLVASLLLMLPVALRHPSSQPLAPYAMGVAALLCLLSHTSLFTWSLIYA